MWLIGITILGLAIAGIVLGWIAYFRVLRLEKTLAALSTRLDQLGRTSIDDRSAHIDTNLTAPATRTATAHQITESPSTIPAPAIFDLEIPDDDPSTPSAAVSPSTSDPSPMSAAPVDDIETGDKESKHVAGNLARNVTAAKPQPETWKNQWMIWMGGLCVALAGIFMVKYSIEQGLLGPVGRISMAIISGLILHLGAEWLLRQRGAHPAFAAMAGGASITLYAALLAALHMYQLMSANLVFGLLAAVSMATMVLSLRQGPILAAFGLLGAYLVPILVSTGSNNVAAAMIYALIISVSGLLLIRYVYRPWLWWGIICGLLGWWLIAVASGGAMYFQGIYLGLATYLLLAVPAFDWLLSGRNSATDALGAANVSGPHSSALWPTLFVVTGAWSISLCVAADAPLKILHWAPLVFVLGLASRNHSRLTVFSWLSLVLACIAIIGAQLEYAQQSWQLQVLDSDTKRTLMIFALQFSVLYMWLEAIGLYRRPYSHLKTSLLCLAPLCWLATMYFLTGDLSGSWQWSIAAVILGLVYGGLSGYQFSKTPQPQDDSIIWLILTSHIAYSLAMAMYFREAGLTLALSAQLITLCWLVRRFHYPWLSWFVKAVVAIVVARLSLNPWLLSYPSDIHWSLWTYGGSTAFCALAAWLVGKRDNLRPWLEAAGLHLFVLTLGAEVRYWLYDGDIFANRYSLTESAINSCLWAGLGITYFYRARLSQHLSMLYTFMSSVLLVLGLASYLLSVTVLNPLWSGESIASRPLFNLLLLAYGLPVLLMAIVYRLHINPVKRGVLVLAGFGAFLFISMEVRHLWQGQLSLSLPTESGELYTYSAVWLAIAVGCLLYGTAHRMTSLNRYGFILLGLVIGKIFLIDMAGLEGLFRVASFMGLGLSLLALAFLTSKLAGYPGSQPDTQHNDTHPGAQSPNEHQPHK